MTATVTLPRHVRDADVLIAPGRYEARLVDAETAVYFYGKSPRVVLWFQITTFGSAFNVTLPAYFAVRSLNGKPRRCGRFRVGFKSRLARALAAMLGHRPPLDVVPIEDLADKLFVVEVVTVERDSQQHALPLGAKYSKVERVIGVAER